MSENTYFRVEDLTNPAAYKLLVGAVQPRPIAWVSSLAGDGVRNLAPFSFFNVASRDPLMVMLSIGESERDTDSEKDTLRNIRTTREFVVNVVSEDLLAPMVLSSGPEPTEVDEFVLAGLQWADSALVGPPRVADSPMALECVVEDIRAYGTDHVVVGRVLCIHARDGIVTDSFHVRTTVLKPVGRMAGPMYCTGLEPHGVETEVAR